MDRDRDAQTGPFDDDGPLEVDGDLSEDKLSEVLGYGHELVNLDYKRTIDLGEKSDQVELAKDIGAFQVRGGYIVVGADDDGSLTGGMDGVDQRAFDPANLIPMMEKYLPGPLEISRRRFVRNRHDVILICVKHNPRRFSMFHKDGRYAKGRNPEVIRFRRGEIFWRVGTRSERITYDGLNRIIDWLVASGRDRAASSLSLDVARDRYVRHLHEGGKAERTLEDYPATLRRFVEQFDGLKLVDFEGPKGTELIRRGIDSVWGGRSEGTRRKAIFILKGFFRWCSKEGEMLSNPAEHLDLPARKTTLRRAASERELTTLISAQDDPINRIMIQLLGRVGLKKEELRLLKYGDISVSSEFVRIAAHGRCKERYVRIKDEDLLVGLKRQLEGGMTRADFVVHPRYVGNVKRSKHLQGPVGSNPRKPLAPSALHRRFDACRGLAPGLRNVTMEELRLAAGPQEMV
jgi:hypothetical protein